MWKLVIEDDEGKRTIVPLTRDDYSIGRKEGNTIRLTERNVSRDHAKLSRKANGAAPPPPPSPPERGGYVLEDLTSYNGVYVNGLRVAHSQDLQHGDLIQIGDYRIVLQDDAMVEQPATAPPTTDPKSTMPTGMHRQASQLMERPNRLVMLAGPTPGAEYPLEQERMTVGRAEDASVSINHNSVSRLHCEIHALGDGRFEIVDKGSSNGVRVNSAELRRGIIEAGDIIELGDVKFKFVGAGQIFRPGATESQQLAAIGERAAAQIVGKRRSSALPVLLFMVVVGVGGVGAWFFTQRGPKPGPGPDGPQPSMSMAADQQTLDKAKALCLVQTPPDCEQARALLLALPKDSAARGTAEYKSILVHWANDLMARADDQALDDDTRKAMLTKVTQAEELDAVDPKLRHTAAKMLEDLDRAATAADQLPRAANDAGYLYDAGTRRHYDAGAYHFDAAAPAATDTAHPATSGNLDTESQAVLNGNTNSARQSLQARVYSGQATPAETMLLRSLCREQGDKTCVATCNSLLQPKTAPSAPH
jgi:pSer/pThr/pTyr-binding forkhead associated (FHA) protein